MAQCAMSFGRQYLVHLKRRNCQRCTLPERDRESTHKEKELNGNKKLKTKQAEPFKYLKNHSS